jgi:LysR family glycine cleavage system transcriptional activator
MPRLADFQLHHPHIKVRVVAANDQTDVNREQVDVRIRYGHGKWTDLESILLFQDELCPVCSPNLLPPAGRPYPVELLQNQTLLHAELRTNDWPDWLNAAGAPKLVARDNLHFDELSVTFQAAIAGIGVAMGQRMYVREELASGVLFEPFEPVLRRDLGYYLVYPPERREARHIAAFREWLVHQFEELET